MFGDDDFSAGCGIATFPQIFMNRRKIPEIYESYAFASLQRGFDDFERCLDQLACGVSSEAVLLANSGHDFTLGQCGHKDNFNLKRYDVKGDHDPTFEPNRKAAFIAARRGLNEDE